MTTSAEVIAELVRRQRAGTEFWISHPIGSYRPMAEIAPTSTGFVFADCRITFPYGNPATYLGRPWRESSQAVFIRCELGAGVKPEGWKEWRVEPPLIRFAEYQSRGPGAGSPEKPTRVSWATFSTEPAPAAFDRAAVLGDWQPPAAR